MNQLLVRISALLVVLASLVCSFPGTVLAMPFNAAVNYPAGNEPIFIAAGDFNRDGKPDLAVANYWDNNIAIYLGRGDGTFNTPVTCNTGSNPTSIAVGDFDRDGKPDMAVTNSNDSNVSIFIGNGDGTFAAAVNYSTGPNSCYVATGDFNGDSNLDLVVVVGHGMNVWILQNAGDGTFVVVDQIVTGSSPTSAAVGDFNRDGKLDIAVTNSDSHSLTILIGNGDCTFVSFINYVAGEYPASVAVGDFNGDSILDVAVAKATESLISIRLGKGDGEFNLAVDYAAGQYPNSVAVSDFNCDGKLDLAVGNQSYDGKISIFTGKGDGTFDAPVVYNTGRNTWTVTVADFNRDGYPDVAGANMGSNNISVLLNTIPAPTITSISPNSGSQGQTLTSVTITGANLLNASTVSFGSYITVNGFTVNSPTRITASIKIAGNAVPGTRTVSVTTPGGTCHLNNVFIVNQAQIGTANLSSGPQGSSMSGSTAAPPQGPVSLPTVSVKSASLSATKVAPGTPVTVTADVANTGTANGTSSIKVYVNSELENSQGVTVNSGSSTPVTFTVSRNEPGTYSVYVGGTQAGSFTVDQFADPNLVLYISGALLVFAFVIGALFITRRKQLQ